MRDKIKINYENLASTIKKCPYCYSEIDSKARWCPSCRKKVGAVKKDGVARKRYGLLYAMGVVFMFIILMSLFGVIIGKTKSAKDEPKFTGGIDSIDVYIAAKRYVSVVLKHPHTAKFEPHYRAKSDIKQIGHNTFEIKSYVDSQNDFGATIRTYFTCIIKHHGQKNFELIQLKEEW